MYLDIATVTYLVFANDQFNDVIHQPCIGKCGALNLMGDDALKGRLAEAKGERDQLQKRLGAYISSLDSAVARNSTRGCG